MLSLIAALCLTQTDAGIALPASTAKSAVTFRAGAEAELSAFGTSHEIDGLLTLRPLLSLTAGEHFEVELGPSFRLRAIDSEPSQRSTDLGGILRGEDWDSLSDYGQILRELRLDTEALTLRAGAFRKKTLGLGHLVNRYSNQDNPNYHPAGVSATLNIGPSHGELLISDVLGARLFAADFTFDLGRFFSKSPQVADRFLASLEVAHDFGLAGGTTVPITLGHFDASAVIIRTSTVRLLVLAGFGGRGLIGTDQGFRGIGALFGVASDLTLGPVRLSLRGELRKNNLGFRQSLFGPGYELARFSGIGLTQPGVALEALPDGYSIYAEVRSSWGELVAADVVAEHFSQGRTDLDSTVSLNLLASRLVAAARFTAVGLGVGPRFMYSAELRFRLVSSLYLLANGGALYFPQNDATLRRGGFAGLGLGGDVEF